MPWEATIPRFSSSYLGQGQPYQTTGLRGLLSPRALAFLLTKKGSHLSLPCSTLSPPLPPLRPSAVHLSRGSLQSQDNLETSAGLLPGTLKKLPPSLLFSRHPHFFCTPPPHPTALPALLLITGTLLYFFPYPHSALPLSFGPLFAFSPSFDCD